MNYDDDDYSQGYSQFKEAFRALTKFELFHIYQMMIPDLQKLELMTLAITYTFLMKDISKISQLPNQSKQNIKLMESLPIMSMDLLWY